MGHVTTMTTELMREYVSIPKPVLAVQLTDENAKSVALMVGGKLYPRDKFDTLRIYFHCCNGRMKLAWGDWVLKDAKGFHAMTNSEFTTTYQERA